MLGVVGEERHKNFKIRDSGAEIEGKQNFTEISLSQPLCKWEGRGVPKQGKSKS